MSKEFTIQLCSQLNIVEGKMQYLYDENGKRYLDCFGGIVTVSCGHCHPDIVNAVVEQTKLLQHTTTIYLHHAIVEFAEALTSKMPGNLKVNVLSVCLGAAITRTFLFMYAGKS
jgi:4-aminobutyrate aminotransferase-like enzyme